MFSYDYTEIMGFDEDYLKMKNMRDFFKHSFGANAMVHIVNSQEAKTFFYRIDFREKSIKRYFSQVGLVSYTFFSPIMFSNQLSVSVYSPHFKPGSAKKNL